MPKYSEFEGKRTTTGARVNPLGSGMAPKASDKLRSVYLTGTEDPDAPIYRGIFHGFDDAEIVQRPSRIP